MIKSPQTTISNFVFKDYETKSKHCAELLEETNTPWLVKPNRKTQS